MSTKSPRCLGTRSNRGRYTWPATYGRAATSNQPSIKESATWDCINVVGDDLVVRDLQLIHLTELVGHCLRGRDHTLITYCDPSFRVQGQKFGVLPCTNPSLTRLVKHCR